MNMKEFLRGRMEKKQKENLHTLQTLVTHLLESRDIKQEWPLLPQTVARLNKDYKISLLHCYCAKIIKLNLMKAYQVSAMEHSQRLK